MALSFPSSPINGAVAGDYTYDATKTAWRKNGAYPVSVTHSDVAPSNPRVGDQWWKSNEGTLFTYYYDGSSYQWVESTNVIANVEPNPIPAGAMMAWASDVIPTNWLLCDGSSVSRSTYASLFAIIGTQYGVGDGTTTFNLPNLKGRTIVGKDGSQTEFDVLGETGGAKTHTLTQAEMPSHTHIQDAHSHLIRNANGAGGNGLAASSGTGADDGNYAFADQWYTSSTVFAAASTTATNQSTGGGGAHNNLQPYIVLNYIIKYSAGETPGDSQLATRVGVAETRVSAVESRATTLETIVTPHTTVSGGTVASDALYYYHAFTGNGTLTISGSNGLVCDYIIVGGGGGGGETIAGGGGGGGVIYKNDKLSAGSYAIVVGAGGAGAPNNSTAYSTGSNGGASSFNGLTALGGGAGGGYNQNPGDGGSGGGVGGAMANVAWGTIYQGHTGGQAYNNTNGGGGGGGAASSGEAGRSNGGGTGGSGFSSNIWNNNRIEFGAGGGGGGRNTPPNALGGSRWAGYGGTNGGAGASGGANSGGGGGGGGYADSGGARGAGGSGGSGVVVIRYEKTQVQ